MHTHKCLRLNQPSNVVMKIHGIHDRRWNQCHGDSEHWPATEVFRPAIKMPEIGSYRDRTGIIHGRIVSLTVAFSQKKKRLKGEKKKKTVGFQAQWLDRQRLAGQIMISAASFWANPATRRNIHQLKSGHHLPITEAGMAYPSCKRRSTQNWGQLHCIRLTGTTRYKNLFRAD